MFGLYFDMTYPPTGQRTFTIALGCFVDDVFPPPTTEFFTMFRHPWVAPLPDAVRIYDAIDADAALAWRKADPRGDETGRITVALASPDRAVWARDQQPKRLSPGRLGLFRID